MSNNINIQEFAEFEHGDIINISMQDYIVIDKNGKKDIELFNSSWHNDVFEVKNDCAAFSQFITEFIAELDDVFPETSQNMKKLHKLQMAACLWKKYNADNNTSTV